MFQVLSNKEVRIVLCFIASYLYVATLALQCDLQVAKVVRQRWKVLRNSETLRRLHLVSDCYSVAL